MIKAKTGGMLLLLIMALAACTNPGPTQAPKGETSSPPPKPTTAGSSVLMHPKHPHIPLAEKGITVVNPQGWKKQEMEFHLGYCQDMFAKTPEIDAAEFCECFLNKIQYYYEPIYFKEAYEDQQKWNSQCLEGAKK